MSVAFTSGRSDGFSATSIWGPSLVARAAATATIAVGRGDGHTFSPDNVKVNPGDVVKFEFFPAKHAVARAEYVFPCVPYESTGAGKTGFFSGFFNSKEESNNPESWSITVNDTNPIYFYDSAPRLCLEHTMVGVINPEDDGSIYRQKDAARNTKEYRSPGADTTAEQKPAEAKPAEGSSVASSSSSSPLSPSPNSSEGSLAVAASNLPAPPSGSAGSSSTLVSTSGSSSSVLPSSNTTEATSSASSAAPSSGISALASPSLSSSSSSSASASPKETSSLTSSSASPKSASTTTSPKPLTKPGTLSTGTIAGIAVGGLAATALLLTLLFLFRARLLALLLSLVRRRKTRRRTRSTSRSPNANNADEEPPGSPMSFHDRAAPDSFPWANTPAFVAPQQQQQQLRASRASSRVQDELHFSEEVERALPPIRVVGHRKRGSDSTLSPRTPRRAEF
ncbi:hypothetical protein W97_00462 [Coniosporium apollinis CBS 100218]|uniref:Phytocyanin domain-containing protein n=1 Tax=Coniosporium apollinis (strain CBS 100218) TaxID=1168221 RepID=R7YHH4_CONA1|nr:uncharacterized protein W97_00462 [Coniosporium apollinis CBS 100218]EON61249.1 hypothetical protein W97_00462 [Coniosporium apollinis CBS 100218]